MYVPNQDSTTCSNIFVIFHFFAILFLLIEVLNCKGGGDNMLK